MWLFQRYHETKSHGEFKYVDLIENSSLKVVTTDYQTILKTTLLEFGRLPNVHGTLPQGCSGYILIQTFVERPLKCWRERFFFIRPGTCRVQLFCNGRNRNLELSFGAACPLFTGERLQHELQIDVVTSVYIWVSTSQVNDNAKRAVKHF